MVCIYSHVVQVVNEDTETVYCVKDAAARLKQHKSFTANAYQLVYRLDDVSTPYCHAELFCVIVNLIKNFLFIIQN